MSQKWWQFSLTASDAEERSFSLWEIPNVAGVEVSSSSEIICTYKGEQNSIEEVSKLCAQFGFEVRQFTEVSEINWVQKCEEVWQPIQVGNFSLIPTLKEELKNTPSTPSTIKIIPGLGFGTGHHASTQLAIELLCSLKSTSHSPQTVLDLGTGSGILAIAAHKLWNAKVLAVDIDADALSNARENVVLNSLEDHITLQQGEIEATLERFDLIIANIYAEVLVSLVDDFRKRLLPRAPLLLSGIMPTRMGLVKSSFLGSKWKMLNEVERDGWMAVLYLKL